MTKIKASKIKDYTEKTWFLGTDVVENEDLELMEKNKCTTFSCEEGAMYYLGHDSNILEKMHMTGYSLIEILKPHQNK